MVAVDLRLARTSTSSVSGPDDDARPSSTLAVPDLDADMRSRSPLVDCRAKEVVRIGSIQCMAPSGWSRVNVDSPLDLQHLLSRRAVHALLSFRPADTAGKSLDVAPSAPEIHLVLERSHALVEREVEPLERHPLDVAR